MEPESVVRNLGDSVHGAMHSSAESLCISGVSSLGKIGKWKSREKMFEKFSVLNLNFGIYYIFSSVQKCLTSVSISSILSWYSPWQNATQFQNFLFPRILKLGNWLLRFSFICFQPNDRTSARWWCRRRCGDSHADQGSCILGLI